MVVGEQRKYTTWKLFCCIHLCLAEIVLARFRIETSGIIRTPFSKWATRFFNINGRH